MKKIPLQITLLLLLFLSSCQDELFYYFSDDERKLLVYEVGDIFKLLKEPEQDTIALTVHDIIYDSIKSSALGLHNNNMEVYEAWIEGNDHSSGTIYAFKDQTIEMEIVLIDAYDTAFKGKLCDTLYNYKIKNKEYLELFVFAETKGQSPMLYFTKDEGIVYIDSTSSGNSYSLIEYIKSE